MSAGTPGQARAPEARREFPRNFVDHLRALAAARPADVGLVVVGERDGAPADTSITYEVLDRRVRALAAELQGRFAKGERALLLLDNDDHYVVAFFACLYAGLVAVPVFPPESARPQHVERLVGIAKDAQARCILTTRAIQDLIGMAAQAFGGAVAIAVDTVDSAGADRWVPHEPADEDIAFLQYTSGSTSAPKGVMVAHRNLMANERAIEHRLSVGADDVFVSWLPLYHDMGLIGGLLQPFHRGIKVALMTPRFFLERPVRWLEAIARHRGTISGGPDFAYRLCVERVSEGQAAGLDLSTWCIAFSGAEPVRHDTLEAFIGHFAPTGFAASAVYPCYGLAEATLLVSGGERGAGMAAPRFLPEGLREGRAVADAGGQPLVACGLVAAEHAVSIRETESEAERDRDEVGEIWVAGPSIAQGYWGRSQETAETFVERDGRRWLRTGDLGFMHDGQLYVAGRVKDLIIVRGHNLYPQDIERAIEREVEAVRKGRVAAFAMDGPEGEGIGMAAEVSRSLQKLIAPQALVDMLGEVVGEACGEPLSVVVLLNPGALPKTSSGKLQRQACRQGWLDGSLDAYATYAQGLLTIAGTGSGASEAASPGAAPPEGIELELAAIWAEVLRTGPLARDAHFFSSGGNSLAAAQLAARIAARWDVEFPLAAVFEHPRLDACAAEIRRCLAAGPGRREAPIPALPPERRREPLPLSHAQRRQWFLWQLDPAGTAYHVQGAVRLVGALDVEAVAAAVEGLAARHESLRTVFHVRADGEVEQRILEAGRREEPAGALHDDAAAKHLPLQVVDLRAVPPDTREARAADALRGLNVWPFDLTCGPLARAALIRLADRVHVLALVMHHIVSDGASMQILVDEIAACYAARLQGSAPVLPELPIQYADYAVWHGQWLAAGERDRQLAYWREQLRVEAGEGHPVLSLPTDHPRPAVARYRAAQHAFELPEALLAGLRAVAEARGATLFMVLLAGFQALLHRYTGQRDIRVGVPVANRRRPETQGVVGFLVNTLVLRARLDGRTRLGDILTQAREAALGAQANQDLPFEQLVEALQPERSLAHSPLFQVLFNHLQEDYRALQGLPGLSATGEPAEPDAAQFDLSVELRERPDGGLGVRFIYAAELFEAGTIERQADHYVAVLTALLTRPDRPVSEVELLSGAERAELVSWGVSAQRFQDAEPVHRLIERQACERPDAVALVFGDEALSYAALNRRANRLAHRLIGLGVKPESRVGIAVERSVEMVVGLLAILKAGGAYVPLDPDYPAERLRYMVEDSGIGLLLTQRRVRDRIPSGRALETVELDVLDLDGEPEHDPPVAVHGENLAYVIYTSGSTGRPKGAANRHRSLHNRLAWMQAAYGLAESDAVLQKTPFSFDVSVWEFFWPLMTGARLVVAGPGDHRDPARLTALIRQHRITTLHFVPSMLQAFLAHEGIEACTSLARIACSGEALPAEMQNAVFKRLPRAALSNLYGPTEAAIDVTHWTCRDDGGSQVPIGRPIADTKTYVLDDALDLAPRGVAGELYLGGAGLGRGYLGRPGLTAERFVADPFDEAGGRLYRTGDLVRWNLEGQLEYLGRLDHQVKVRGFRIELGEVEAQLLAQPEVREAVVVVREGPGGTRLVAYVAAQADHRLEADALRARLREVLPDYMVPSAIVTLEALPVTANGKVDRKGLPEPELAGRAYEAPQGHVGQAIAAIWAEVLGIDKVGAAENFFDLGGHSLQLIRVHRLLEDRLQTGLSVIELFKFPTVGALARRIEQGPDEVRTCEAGTDAAPAHDAGKAMRRRAALIQRRRAAERID